MNLPSDILSQGIRSFGLSGLWAMCAMLSSCAHNPYATPAHQGPLPFQEIQLGEINDFSFERTYEANGAADTVLLDSEVHIPFVALTKEAEELLRERQAANDSIAKKVRKICFYGGARNTGGTGAKDWNLVCRVDTHVLGQSIFFAFHPEVKDTHTLVLNDFDAWSSIPATVMQALGGASRKAWRSWFGGMLQDAINKGIVGVLPSASQGAAVKKVAMLDWVMSVTIAYESLPAGRRSRLGKPIIIVKPLED